MSLLRDIFTKLRTLINVVSNSLNNLVSEEPSTSSMVNVPKHCSNLNEITFINFIDNSEPN